MIRNTLTAAALAAVLAVPALAQQPAGTAGSPASNTGSTAQQAPVMPQQTASNQKPGFVQNQAATEWRASKLIGASVYGPDNASIGEINDVIIGADGQFKAAVVGVGGFLGVGEKDVALPFEALAIARKPDSASIDKVTVRYSKDELKNAPKFAYFESTGSSATTGAGARVPGGTSDNMKK